MIRHVIPSALAVLLALSGGSWAASKLYVNPETPITFGDSATTENLDLQNLATTTGRLSSVHDRGASARAGCYEWRCTLQTETTVTVGNAAEIYLATGNGTNMDGEIAVTDTADAALTTDKRLNLRLLGTVIADQTAATVNMTASNEFCTGARYLALGVWNAMGVNLENTANANKCSLTPMPWETSP